MTGKSAKPCLSAVYVDYDNIYLSLKRKSEEAAKRFAKDAGAWVREIQSGRLITPTNTGFEPVDRRIVMNRCYGNPVPRRNSQDNSTDMNSFPFVRHHFLRSGFEVIDCPPLTAQLKNSSDIRMVMDVRDFLTHDTYFDEFVIMSGDADFTPVLHRLRAHARRTVIFANDYTAAPYTSICDGEIRESDLISLLIEGRLPSDADGEGTILIETESTRNDAIRGEIMHEVVTGVRAAAAPVPLEALADRALRNLGHDKTAGTGWAGAGGFRELLSQSLPDDIKLSEQAPYYAYDVERHAAPLRVEAPAALIAAAAPRPDQSQPQADQPVPTAIPSAPPLAQVVQEVPAAAAEQQPQIVSAQAVPAAQSQSPQTETAEHGYGLAAPAPVPALVQAPVAPEPAVTASAAVELQPVQIVQAAATPASEPQRSPEAASAVQQSIARIHDACQAPPLAPPEYRLLFEVMAAEINERGLTGAQTLVNIASRAQDAGIDLRSDDVRFVLEVVSEADPWFEQGASANLFAGRFRNFVVARCRGQGLNLSVDELDLIEAWFAGSGQQLPVSQPAPAPSAVPEQFQQAVNDAISNPGDIVPADDLPRIVTNRRRG